MIKDYLTLAFRSIKHRSLRSWLTVIGIVIGIASIVALITISQGLENAVKGQFEQMGSDKLTITGPISSGYISSYLDDRDLEIIRSLAEIEWASPWVLVSSDVEYNRETQFIQQIIGVDTDIFEESFEDMNYGVIEGRFIKPNEKGKVVIGYAVGRDLFKKDVHLNNQLEIKGVKFEVTGVIEEIGNPDDDQSMYLAIEDLREIFNKSDDLTMVMAKVKQGNDIDFVAEKLTDKLEDRKGETESFDVLTPEQLLAQVGDILILIQVILGGIASISLLVGGIGIMNTMYTAVLQRTKEIGIMKSIGATNKAISSIFLVEGALFGIAGGIIGVALGTIMAYLVKNIADQAGYKILVIKLNPTLVIFVLIFSIGIGLLSTWWPARRAVKLKPVDALR
jgi:putative ABC transport system permease protein